MKLTRKTWLAIVAGAVLASPAAIAADHMDGPAVIAEPTADITDVFAWMTDATHMALIMDVHPFATATGTSPSQFSNAVKYVFHTTSWSTFAGAPTGEIDIICTFDGKQNPSCWVAPAGDTKAADVMDYVTGTAANAMTAAGITSSSGKLQLFAGPRNDPFFFNLQGFQTVIGNVQAALDAGVVGPSAFNAAGCPTLGTMAGQLATQLGEAADGGAAVDAFAGADVLSIVLNVNTSLLLGSSGNTLLSVWASTNN